MIIFGMQKLYRPLNCMAVHISACAVSPAKSIWLNLDIIIATCKYVSSYPR